jgi:hypothetical protein
MADTIILSTEGDLEKVTRRIQSSVNSATALKTLGVDILPSSTPTEHSLSDLARKELVCACQANQSITKILVRTHYLNHPDYAGTVFLVLLEGLGHLPQLELADMNLRAFDGEQFASIVGPAVTCFLRQAKNLNKLCLRYARIGGHEAQRTIQDWSSALARLSSLEEFSFTQCSLDPDLAFQSVFDPVLMALSQLPTLISLSLIERHAQGLFSTTAFLALIAATKLKQVICYRWRMPILGVLTHQMESKPHATLQKLVLDFDGDLQSYHDVAAILQACTSLVSLELRHDWRLHLLLTTEEGGMIAVAKALRHTTMLRTLIFPFNGEPCSVPILEAFADSLQVNYTLQELKLSGCNRTWGMSVQEASDSIPVLFLVAKILFFLYLNNAGRGEVLHESTPAATWVQKLEQHKDELCCLFYYLSSNPTLCDTTSLG